MIDAFRTPDELLIGLPDFPFESRYREFEGIRLAHLDLGDGPPVVFLHGEPTWSFLWRHVIPPVREAGFRCLAPDLPGFGRSDKPVELGWYSYDRHTASVLADLPVGLLVRRACLNDPGDEVIAGYDAPFPVAAAKAGARAFPLILPLTPTAPGASAGQRVLEALRGEDRPKLFLWAESDPVLPLETGRRFAAALGGEIDHVIAGASHFLQEDAGPEIGRLIADWLS